MPKFRSKWNIVTDRLEEARTVVAQLESQLAGLEATPTSGIHCSGCDMTLRTEGDFARHFYVPDSRYLNLGECPFANNGKTPSEQTTYAENEGV